LELSLGLGLEVAAFRQRFLLLDEPVADLGRLRPFTQLSLAWNFP
jgi:hypothetical protein